MGNRELSDRYVNPYTDFGFKKLFGTEMNKELLISFINSLLTPEDQIVSLSYLNTEHLGSGEADRRAVFDVYCENERGEKILVEMQRGEQQYFKDRSIYYACSAASSSTSRTAASTTPPSPSVSRDRKGNGTTG